MAIQRISSVIPNYGKNFNLKNNNFNHKSFKGYTETQTITRPYYMVGTDKLMTVSEKDIKHPDNTYIHYGLKGYNHRTTEEAVVDVYYADPGERITDEIREGHKFIVTYNVPVDISDEQIEEAKTKEELSDIVSELKANDSLLKRKNSDLTYELVDIAKRISQLQNQLKAVQQEKYKKSAEKVDTERAAAMNRLKISRANEKLNEIES